MPGKNLTVNTESVAFTCKNALFQTNISKPLNTFYPGSVTQKPIYEDRNGKTLLLERVIHNNGEKYYWFMWYQKDGLPLIPLSGVIDEDHILEVIKNISKISF